MYLCMHTLKCVRVQVCWGQVASIGSFFPLLHLVQSFCFFTAQVVHLSSVIIAITMLSTAFMSIVGKAAITEIRQFCQQLSSEVVGAQAGTGGVNQDEWGVMQSPKSLNSAKIFDGHDQ